VNLTIYWIHILHKLLNLLKLEVPEQFLNCFNSIPKDRKQDLYNQVIKLIEDDFETICSFSDLLNIGDNFISLNQKKRRILLNPSSLYLWIKEKTTF
jgi:formate dehydrogenase maturation protein FdhE